MLPNRQPTLFSSSTKQKASKLSRAKRNIAIIFSTGKSKKKNKDSCQKSTKRYTHYLNNMMKKRARDHTETRFNAPNTTQPPVFIHPNTQMQRQNFSAIANAIRPHSPKQVMSPPLNLPTIFELPSDEDRLASEVEADSRLLVDVGADPSSWSEGLIATLAQTNVPCLVDPLPVVSVGTGGLQPNVLQTHPEDQDSPHVTNDTVDVEANEYQSPELPDLPELEGDYPNNSSPAQPNYFLHQQIDALRTEIWQLKRNVSDKAAVVSECMKARKSLETRLDSYETQLSINATYLTEYKGVAQQAEGDRKLYKELHESEQEHHLETLMELSQAQKEAENNGKKLMDTRTRLKKVTTRNAGMARQISRLTRQLREAEAALKSSESKDAKLQRLERENARLTRELKSSKASTSDWESASRRLIDERSNLRLENAKLQTELQRARNKEAAIKVESKTYMVIAEHLKLQHDNFKGSFEEARKIFQKEAMLRRELQMDFAKQSIIARPELALKALTEAHNHIQSQGEERTSQLISQLEQYASSMLTLEESLEHIYQRAAVMQAHNTVLAETLQNLQVPVPPAPKLPAEQLDAVSADIRAALRWLTTPANNEWQSASTTANPSAQPNNFGDDVEESLYQEREDEDHSAQENGYGEYHFHEESLPPRGFGFSSQTTFTSTCNQQHQSDVRQFPSGFASADQANFFEPSDKSAQSLPAESIRPPPGFSQFGTSTGSATQRPFTSHHHASRPQDGSSRANTSRDTFSNGDGPQHSFAQPEPFHFGNGTCDFNFSVNSPPQQQQQQQMPQAHTSFAQHANAPTFTQQDQDCSYPSTYGTNSPRQRGQSRAAGCEHKKRSSRFAPYYKSRSSAQEGRANTGTDERSFGPAPGSERKRSRRGKA